MHVYLCKYICILVYRHVYLYTHCSTHVYVCIHTYDIERQKHKPAYSNIPNLLLLSCSLVQVSACICRWSWVAAANLPRGKHHVRTATAVTAQVASDTHNPTASSRSSQGYEPKSTWPRTTFLNPIVVAATKGALVSASSHEGLAASVNSKDKSESSDKPNIPNSLGTRVRRIAFRVYALGFGV